METRTDGPAADPLAVRDKALGLRESVNASRTRMRAQQEQLARLKAEVTVLRELAALGAAPPAVSSVPSPLPLRADAAPRPVLAPVAKEAAADSAPSTVSFGTDWLPFARSAAPYAAIAVFAVAVQLKPPTPPASALTLAEAPAAAPKPLPADAAPGFMDDGAAEALLLVHEWRLPGDERTIADRLDDGVELPGSEPAWDAERTGERSYRVSYRPPAGEPSYDFDVDLDARRVDPTPETAELIAPRLTARR